MRAIICEYCKKIIYDESEVRLLKCTKTDTSFIWEKEICVACALKIETKLNSTSKTLSL